MKTLTRFLVILLICSFWACAAKQTSLGAPNKRLVGYEGPPEVQIKVYPRLGVAGPKPAEVYVHVRVLPDPDNESVALQYRIQNTDLLFEPTTIYLDGDKEKVQVISYRLIQLHSGDYTFSAILKRKFDKKIIASTNVYIK